MHRAPPRRRLLCSLERDLEAHLGNEMLGSEGTSQGVIRGPEREREEGECVCVCLNMCTWVWCVHECVCSSLCSHMCKGLCVYKHVYISMVYGCAHVPVCVCTCVDMI